MTSVLLFMFVLFVFVFKQKTAYEMRISDWSSDVCSSDLVYKAAFGNGNAGDLDIRSRHPEQSLDGRLVTQNFFCEIVAFARFFGEEFDQFGLVGQAHYGRSDCAGRGLTIGRASGRERVCQYV